MEPSAVLARSISRRFAVLLAAAALAALSRQLVMQRYSDGAHKGASTVSDGEASLLESAFIYHGEALLQTGFAAAALRPSASAQAAARIQQEPAAALRGPAPALAGDASQSAAAVAGEAKVPSSEHVTLAQLVEHAPYAPLPLALVLATLSALALWVRCPAWRRPVWRPSAETASELTQPAVTQPAVFAVDNRSESTRDWSRRSVLASAMAAPLVSVLPEPAEAAEARADVPIQTEPILTEACQTYPGGGVCGDVLLSNGTIVTVKFESRWPTMEGRFGAELEKRSAAGDAAFLQVKTLAKNERFEKLAPDWFASAVCAVSGRYGKYGAPYDIAIEDVSSKGTEKKKGERNFLLKFVTLSPNSLEFPRTAMIRAVLAPGSDQDVMLFTVTTQKERWEEQEEIARETLASLAIPRTRKTELKFSPQNDYRASLSSFSGMVSDAQEQSGLDENGFPVEAVPSLDEAKRFGLV